MARKPRKPGRSPANRNPYERVLIVCEGTKTEPKYFEAVIAKLKLTSAEIIDIDREPGPTPNAIANRAIRKIKEAKDAGNPYDKIFCVFDRDRHEDFETASDKMVKHSCTLARSWPCFEYWLLLHFDYKRTDFVGIKSDHCIKALEKRIKKENNLPKYRKNYNDFESLMDKLDVAIKNSKQSLKDKKSMEKDSTTIEKNITATEVHKVVECLMNIRP